MIQFLYLFLFYSVAIAQPSFDLFQFRAPEEMDLRVGELGPLHAIQFGYDLIFEEFAIVFYVNNQNSKILMVNDLNSYIVYTC